MSDKPLVPSLYVSIDQVRDNPELHKLVLTGQIIVAYMSQRALDVITAPTPKEIIEQRKGPGGVMLSYVPHVYYREKLAQAYGFDYSWDCDVQVDWEHAMVIGRGKLTVRLHNPLTGEVIGNPRIATGVDGQPITMKQSGGPLDIGNDLKTVDSNAFKIACKNLGFFADLYRDDDQRSLAEIEAGGPLPEGKVINGHATKVTPLYTCQACGKDIEAGVTKSGKAFTADEMARTSHDRYHIFLCQTCYAEQVKSDRERLEADVQAAVRKAEEKLVEKSSEGVE